MHLIVTFVPESHLEAVKQALFAAGAGRSTRYEQCCWQTAGLGQFRPLPGSQPFRGEENTLGTCAEYRLEMICTDEHIEASIAALLAAHPYEEPAWAAWPARPAFPLHTV